MLRIDGNISFTFFDRVDKNKRILILGEIHNSKNLCANTESSIGVHKYLFDLAMNSPECLDIFLEAESTGKVINIYKRYYNGFIKLFKTKSTKEHKILEEMKRIASASLSDYTNPITPIRQIFGSCDLSSQGNDCPIPNLRYHYIDLRLQNDFKGLFSLYNNFIDPIYLLPTNKLGLKAVSDLIDTNNRIIFEYLVGFDISLNAKETFNHFFSLLYSESLLDFFSKQHKEYLKIYKKELKTAYHNIRDFQKFKDILYYSIILGGTDIDFIVSESNDDVLKFDDPIKKYMVDSIKEECKTDKDYGLNVSIINFFVMKFLLTAQMDVYFLLRWFSDRNNISGGCGGKEFKRSKNSVVYVGAAHAETYTNFFKLFFETEPKIERRNHVDNNCMVIGEAFDFFS